MSWTAHIDGGSRGNPGPAAAGVSVDDEKGREVFAAGFFLGHKTNNQAEYAALLQALKVLEKAGADSVRVLTDSELLVHQINGVYRVKSADLHPLYEEARRLLSGFAEWKVEYVPRQQNRFADKLVNQALDQRKTVVVRDRLNVTGHGDLDPPRDVAPPLFSPVAGPAGRTAAAPRPGGEPPGKRSSAIEVVVVRAPRKGVCRAGMSEGQQFVFTDVTPGGMCLEACAAVMEAVLALRDAVGEGLACDEATSCRCGHPDCGAVFDIRHVG